MSIRKAGFRAVPSGNHSGVDPLFVPDGFCASAINADFRRGVVQTRPDFNRLAQLDKRGRFQGALAFSRNDRPFIIYAVAGDIYVFDVLLGTEGRVTQDVPRLSKTVERVHFLDTGTYVVVQDGVNTPVIVYGVDGRLSDPRKDSPLLELPGEIGTGTIMAFAYGRIALAMTDSASFMLGDVAIPLRYPDNYLYFAENQYLQGAGAFETLGRITALSSWSQLDTPTGLGGLLVFTQDSVESYDIATDRRIWGQQPISRVILDRGAVGPQAVCRMNNDVFFRSRDGIYSIRSARAEVAQNVFLAYSRFNDRFLRHDDPGSLHLVSSGVHDKRVLFTCAPKNWLREDDGLFETTFRAMAVFDHDVDAAPRSAVEIASGAWTGLDIHQIVPLKDRCYLMVRGRTGGLELWEIDGHTGLDAGTTPIATTLYTPAYDFGDRTVTKKLDSASVWLHDVSGKVSLDFAVRADRQAWLPVQQDLAREWEDSTRVGYTGPDTSCYPETEPACRDTLPNLQPGSEARLTFTQKNLAFHSLECKITMSGRAELHVLQLLASDHGDAARVGNSKRRLDSLPDDIYTYQVPV